MTDTVIAIGGGLRLRPPARADEAGVAEAGRDPDIRALPWFGAGFHDHWAGPWVERAMQEWAADRNRLFSIVDEADRYLGSINVSPLRDDGVEIAYWVLPDVRRRGVATAAVSALLPWVRQLRPGARIWAKTALGNLASQGVLAKCGFDERGRGKLAYFDWPG